MAGYDSTYTYAKGLFEDAKDFEGKMKAQNLKAAWNAAYSLPNSYPGRQELLSDIENYALSCGINLNSISGYY